MNPGLFLKGDPLKGVPKPPGPQTRSLGESLLAKAGGELMNLWLDRPSVFSAESESGLSTSKTPKTGKLTRFFGTKLDDLEHSYRS